MTVSASASRLDDDFPDFARAVRERLAEIEGPLFIVDVDRLFGVYLSGFTADTRQTYNCHACRRFIEQYGALATINEDGMVYSALWDESLVPFEYKEPVRMMRRAVERALVDGVFLSSEGSWGAHRTRDSKRHLYWEHFDVRNPAPYRNALLTASQAAAEKREDFGMLGRAIGDFSIDTARKALALLKTDTLYRSEKVLGVAEWFVALHEALTRNPPVSYRRRNLLWRAAATAPPGFAHIRSSMIGTLLEDIAAGLDLAIVAKRFAEKMHPLQYQRPTAPPSDGAIAQAEKTVAALGIAGALERRFARLSDVEKLWTPRLAAARPTPAGVFGHLRQGAHAAPTDEIPGTTNITWEKFARTVLPTAEKIELSVPSRGSFIALVTAAKPDAPPILQWDRESKRNPVSWYVYNGGSLAANWGLTTGWAAVTAVVALPSTWGTAPLAHHGEGVILTLAGARDLRHTMGGGFFVEQLRSEFHGVRSVLEAYQLKAPIAGRDEGDACGFDLRKGSKTAARVRVVAEGLQREYLIDRWD